MISEVDVAAAIVFATRLEAMTGVSVDGVPLDKDEPKPPPKPRMPGPEEPHPS